MMQWQENYEFDGEDSDLETACIDRMVTKVDVLCRSPRRSKGLGLSRLEQKFRKFCNPEHQVLNDFWFDEGVLDYVDESIEEKLPPLKFWWQA